MTFDSPITTLDWATRANGIGADPATYLTPAAVDAAAQTIDQSLVTNALHTTTTDSSTSQAAQHNSIGGRLLTRPTGIGAVVLKATLRNTSSLAFFSIRVSYDFDVPGISVTESAPGHRVFWSATGQTNSWTLLTNFSGLNAMASVNETIRFSAPWAPNTEIYLLWLDDNAVTGPDGAYTIDNFAVSEVSTLSISRNPSTGLISVAWIGDAVLQQATAINADTEWTDVPLNPNPHSFMPASSTTRFFRLRQ